jgi:UDP-N-acetylmuramyl tripeptide synthase
MAKFYSVPLGKIVRFAARMRGGGSALPGLFIEKIDPSFVPNTLNKLPKGVVLISGTNGKTTTTKIVVELLESQGLKVFTNPTGSNFVRGVAASLIGEVTLRGKLDADIAVVELDEAHAINFIKQVKPRYCLLLNVMRDQLDRFGEIDRTASLLHEIAINTSGGVIINRDDPRLSTDEFLQFVKAPVRTFGVSQELLRQFPSDDSLKDKSAASNHKTSRINDTSLEKIKESTVEISYENSTKNLKLQLNGIYNLLNAVAAVAVCRMIMETDLDEASMLASLSKVTPAFGRGESISINGQECQLVLVKNPGGFRLGLESFSPEGYATMIAINDNYADGRDMSWLWDVDFDSLQKHGVTEVSGTRAYDMALRLQYEDIAVGHVNPDLKSSLQHFLATTPSRPKRIYCTYTAMMTLRRELGKKTVVKAIS